MLAELQRGGQARVAESAAKLLNAFEETLLSQRARYDHLCRQYGVDLRQFHIAAIMSESGVSLALGPMDTHDAVMRAMELSEEGYDRIILKDAATLEEMHFRAPAGFGAD
jgi:hypothetical protein